MTWLHGLIQRVSKKALQRMLATGTGPEKAQIAEIAGFCAYTYGDSAQVERALKNQISPRPYGLRLRGVGFRISETPG